MGKRKLGNQYKAFCIDKKIYKNQDERNCYMQNSMSSKTCNFKKVIHFGQLHHLFETIMDLDVRIDI